MPGVNLYAYSRGSTLITLVLLQHACLRELQCCKRGQAYRLLKQSLDFFQLLQYKEQKKQLPSIHNWKDFDTKGVKAGIYISIYI